MDDQSNADARIAVNAPGKFAPRDGGELLKMRVNE
jgi:hypothetical protein